MNTLNPIKSTQAAYDRIKRYFSKPGAKIARSDLGACQYRTPSGRKCAVGILIPDELYSTLYENTTVSGLLSGEWGGWPDVEFGPDSQDDLLAGLQDYFSNVDQRFLLKAQTLHDGTVGDDAAPFTLKLKKIAAEFGLQP